MVTKSIKLFMYAVLLKGTIPLQQRWICWSDDYCGDCYDRFTGGFYALLVVVSFSSYLSLQLNYLETLSDLDGVTFQLLIMPALTTAVGEVKLLSLGLFVSCVHVRWNDCYHFLSFSALKCLNVLNNCMIPSNFHQNLKGITTFILEKSTVECLLTVILLYCVSLNAGRPVWHRLGILGNVLSLFSLHFLLIISFSFNIFNN